MSRLVLLDLLGRQPGRVDQSTVRQRLELLHDLVEILVPRVQVREDPLRSSAGPGGSDALVRRKNRSPVAGFVPLGEGVQLRKCAEEVLLHVEEISKRLQRL